MPIDNGVMMPRALAGWPGCRWLGCGTRVGGLSAQAGKRAVTCTDVTKRVGFGWLGRA
jgi:hypothetical protein